MQVKEKTIWAWHFVHPDRKLGYGDGLAVRPGYRYSVETPIEMCGNGLHASVLPLDAERWCQFYDIRKGFISRVVLTGEILGRYSEAPTYDNEKLVAQHREVVWMAPVEPAIAALQEWVVSLYKQAVDARWEKLLRKRVLSHRETAAQRFAFLAARYEMLTHKANRNTLETRDLYHHLANLHWIQHTKQVDEWAGVQISREVSRKLKREFNQRFHDELMKLAPIDYRDPGIKEEWFNGG